MAQQFWWTANFTPCCTWQWKASINVKEHQGILDMLHRIYLFPSSRAKPRLQEVWRSEASTHLPSSQTSRPNPPQWLMINVEAMHKQNNINNNIDHISFSDSKSLMQILGQQRQLFLALANILRQPASLQEWACVLKPNPRWVNAHHCW